MNLTVTVWNIHITVKSAITKNASIGKNTTNREVKEMFSFIKDFIEFRKKRNQQRISCKRFMILQVMIKYFNDLQRSKDGVNLPPQIEALNAMKELNTDRKINKMYSKLRIAGLV